MCVVGIAVAVVVDLTVSWAYAPVAAWDVAALVFIIWVWIGDHG